MSLIQTSAFSAPHALRRIEITYFSNVILVAESGIIFKSIGRQVMIWLLLLIIPKESFLNLSFQKWFSLPVGTFGILEMTEFLEISYPPLEGGGPALS